MTTYYSNVEDEFSLLSRMSFTYFKRILNNLTQKRNNFTIIGTLTASLLLSLIPYVFQNIL